MKSNCRHEINSFDMSAVSEPVLHQAIVYFEIRFPCSVDVLERPQRVELLFIEGDQAYPVALQYMSSRNDESSCDLVLTYVTWADLPQGRVLVTADADLRFQTLQWGRPLEANITGETSHTVRRQAFGVPRAPRRGVHCCEVIRSIEISGESLEIYLAAAAEPEIVSFAHPQVGSR